MYQKLFQIALVLFLVVVSVAMLGMLITFILNTFSSPLLARDHSIVFAVGGVSTRQIGFMIVAASLVIAGLYLFVRRRRFRR